MIIQVLSRYFFKCHDHCSEFITDLRNKNIIELNIKIILLFV